MLNHYFLIALLLFSYLVPFRVVGQQLNPGRPNHRPRQYHQRPLGLNSVGPESLAFDCEGHGPYVGVSDGRILKWENTRTGWVEFAVTNPYRSRRCDGVNNSPLERFCGRPLGLKFNNLTCDLYITDSTFGLLRVGRNGGVAVPVATSFGGARFRFLNALDIDAEGGLIYFTDTSLYDNRWNFARIIRGGDRSGRLLRYDINTGRVIVLMRGLSFANGVALSKDKDFILVGETTAGQIRRLWLTGPRSGISEVFLTLNGGRPDNIHRNDKGEFWIAQNPNPPIKVDQYGQTLEVLNGDAIVDVSDIVEYKNRVWIGSVIQSYILYA